jgi:hypothetical protein
VALTAAFLAPLEMSASFNQNMHTLLEKAYRANDEVYTAQDAVRAAGDFQIPRSVVEQDVADLAAAGGDFQQLMHRRRLAVRKDRFSPERVKATFHRRNPEWDNLMDLASNGVPIHAPPDFRPNGDCPEKWRTTSGFAEAGVAVEKNFYENFHPTGLTVILPVDVARHIEGLHVSTANWAPKHGKVAGRPTMNPKAFNGDWAKRLCDDHWGPVQHPDIARLVQMVLDYAERRGVSWDQLILWKMDIRGAYTLIDISAPDVQRMAVKLRDQLLMIFGCGGFGYTGLPGAFHVLTRAFKWELKHGRRLRGDADMYVDDLFGVCLAQDREHDMEIARTLITSALGVDAMATEKDQWSRSLEVIGFIVDLDRHLLSIGERCVLRALHGFMEVDETAAVPVRVLQRLASWAERYSLICVLIAPFQAALYRSYAHHSDMGYVHPLPLSAQKAIWLIRCLLMLTVIHGTQFARPLRDLQRGGKEPCVVAEFDASLTGGGILWFWRDASGDEQLLGGVALDFRRYGFGGDSKFQNCSEFIAAVCAVQGATVLRSKGLLPGVLPTDRINVSLRGDSVTALTWAANSKFRSELVSNAAVVFVLLCVAKNVVVNEVTHLLAEKNKVADALSRRADGVSYEDLARQHPQLRDMVLIDPKVEEILPWCDPRLMVETASEFRDFWSGVREAVAPHS